jgi:hypothetical protein
MRLVRACTSTKRSTFLKPGMKLQHPLGCYYVLKDRDSLAYLWVFPQPLDSSCLPLFLLDSREHID